MCSYYFSKISNKSRCALINGGVLIINRAVEFFFVQDLQDSLRKFGRSQEIWGAKRPLPLSRKSGARSPPVYPSTLCTVKKYLILLQYTDVALENHMDVFNQICLHLLSQLTPAETSKPDGSLSVEFPRQFFEGVL